MISGILNRTVIIMLIIIVTIFVPDVFGQTFQVRRYTTIDGLTGTEVFGIAQDLQGRMWFASIPGISCYDGVNWTHYTVVDGLPSRRFIQLEGDSQGNMWALPFSSLKGAILSYYDNSRWHTFSENKPPQSPPTHFTSLALMQQKKSITAIIGSRGRGVYIWHHQNWQHLTRSDGLISDWVNEISELHGKFYVATDAGLSVLKLNNNNQWQVDNRLNRALNLPAQTIKSISIRPVVNSRTRSQIWLLGNKWIGYFNENNVQFTAFPLPRSFKNEEGLVRMQPDDLNGLYIGSRGSAQYVNYLTRQFQALDNSNGLVGYGINDVMVDFERNIWISCDRGVSKLVSMRFSNIGVQNGLLEDEVTAILEYEPGKFVLGHNKGVTINEKPGFVGRPDSGYRKISFAGIIKENYATCRVLDIKADSKKNIWITLDGAGLVIIDPGYRITWRGEPHGLAGRVTALLINDADDVLVGTSLGVFRYDRKQHRFAAVTLEGVPAEGIKKLFSFSNPGTRLNGIATDNNGLFLLDPVTHKWDNYKKPGNVAANNIYSIFKTTDGKFLAGTRGGLYILNGRPGNPGAMEKMVLGNDSIDCPVFFIAGDRQKRIWLGTDRGVIRWDGIEKKIYSVAHGLSGRETNRAAGIQDSRGRMWIGTNRGVSIYNELFDTPGTMIPPPRLKLLSIKTSAGVFPISSSNSPLVLQAGTHSGILNFQAISFIDERAMGFRYKLAGHDSQWRELSSSLTRKIFYSNLEPGSYRFHIIATNATGLESPELVSPEITILTPFYQTWWFFLLLLAGILILLHSVFRFLTQKRNAGLLKKQVEQRTGELHAVEKRYRNLFKESRDTVFVVSPEGVFIDINPAGVQLLRYDSREDIVSRQVKLPFAGGLPDFEAFQTEIENKDFVKDYETLLKAKGQELVNVLITATPVRDDQDKIVAFRGIIRDITEKKRLEQQLLQAQKMEAIGTLAGGIAHDFNNILGVIVGYTELLVDDLPSETLMSKNASNVLAAANRATDLVKQILAFSRQTERKQRPLDISVIIEEALKLLRSSLPATIEIRHHLYSGSGKVLADPTQIHQVIMNLCTNAAHAMRESGGVLGVALDEISIDEEEAKEYTDLFPGDYLRLSVSDTGHGIPRIVMKRIFEPYFTTKETGEGTGLGLAVIHGIVKSYGGDIIVNSQPDHGTTFYIFLPCGSGLSDNASPGKQLSGAPGGSESILLVDDELPLLQVESQILERLGYDVTGSTLPLQALQIFAAEPHRFHLVITDLTMPRLTGFQLAQKIKQIRPEVPVILCSGFSAELSKKSDENSGLIDEFVMKPLIKNHLARSIRRLLDPGLKGCD